MVKLSNKPDGMLVIDDNWKIEIILLLLPELPPNKSDGILNKDEVPLKTELKLQVTDVLNKFAPSDVTELQFKKVPRKLVATTLLWNKLSGTDVNDEQP